MRDFLISNIIYKVSFMISWVPYALVCIYRVFFETSHMSPFTATLPAMFAKSSMLWSSLLYFLTNRKVRVKALEVFGKSKPAQSMSPSRSSKHLTWRFFKRHSRPLNLINAPPC